MFSTELVVLTGNRRRAARHLVDMPATMSSEESLKTLCRVADLSRHGVRVATYSALPQNSRVSIKLPGLPPYLAEIVWSDEFDAACKFDVPLNEADLQTLVARFGLEIDAERAIESMVMVA